MKKVYQGIPIWSSRLYSESSSVVERKSSRQNKEIIQSDIFTKINNIELPLPPEKFIIAMDSLHSVDAFKNKQYEVELSEKCKDGSILNGSYTGSSGKNSKNGYRYYLESEIGESKIFYINETDTILKLKLNKRF